MKHYYKGKEIKGYEEVVDDSSELELIRFAKINLEKQEKVDLESGEYEIALVIFSGKCTVHCDEEKFMNLGSRKDVFSGKPTTVYIPRDAKYSVEATGDGTLEIGVCKVKAEKKYSPFVVKPEDVVTVHRGKLNWQRNVNDIITNQYENRVDKIVLGETYGYPGQWSSYPSHKHDTDNLPYEVNMEEIYHFKINPSKGFGVQVMYNDDLTLDECYTLRNNDSIAIKEGYHPVGSAPGYEIYYMWVMAGHSGRVLTPNDDPNHAWIKSVEAMVE
ncbi:5-deoxyglucuronate isomerase [Natranaerovirga hydrolytica]|uniref:5-deoxyglucuronate isomerase n=1 Tax=Natranaerovirga hydrolytica TaxID=680378 RepID=A0A4R1N107_9FIRM|nr:5-deoxy-glucuronate isomerase [Natranaerovirga hydrolytica]TCK98592.1 5-deoxyglucuronate isomerase [Natranaerovirga hydrolytica]